MTKLSDPDYFLPVIIPLREIQVLSSGTTKPILIEGLCKNLNIKNEYVLKCKNAPRMSTNSLAFELISSLIGIELDLNIPNPVLIELNNEFTTTIKDQELNKIASNSLGLNFGSLYFEGYMELIRGQSLPNELNNIAKEIFVFDIFISNPDRRIDKPNMLTDGNNILIFDHELAFSFTLAIIKNPEPWILNSELSWIKQHYFYDYLKANKQNFNTFVNKLDRIDDKFWNKLETYIPIEWNFEKMDTIKENLNSFIKNKEKFKNELIDILK